MDEKRREALAQLSEYEAQEALENTNALQRWLIRRGRTHYVGDRTRPGWTGFLPHYLFYCPSCGHYYVDYPHGDRPHVTCHRCRINYGI